MVGLWGESCVKSGSPGTFLRHPISRSREVCSANVSLLQKERDLFRRIKRYRSDPTGQSVNNPVPDYYGEKISSVQGYRRWLKDQRAFRKKREVNVV
jgi:Mitochondrial import protein Pam17